jgi:hypothetical protein
MRLLLDASASDAPMPEQLATELILRESTRARADSS